MTGRATTLACLAAVATAFGALPAEAYDPVPWDLGESASRPEHVTRSPRVTSRSGPILMFGTFGASFDWNTEVGGDVPGVGAGRGYSISVPATLPGWIVYGLAVDPMAVFTPLASDAWTSGFCGDGLGTYPVIDEVAFEFVYSASSHDDLLYGGDLALTRYALGMRMTGPGPTERRLRGSMLLGWSWHDFDFDARPAIQASGPYGGIGVEFRFPGRTPGSALGVRIDARWDFCVGTDGSGAAVPDQVFSTSAGMQFYW
jgi:hypothetical protein